MGRLPVRYYAGWMAPKPPAPSDIADKFMLRLPDGMRDRIAASAKASNRSMNAEIVDRLEATFELEDSGFNHDGTVISSVNERIERLEKMVAEHLDKVTSVLMEAKDLGRRS